METKEILEKVRSGEISVDTAEKFFRQKPFEDLGFAKLDTHREIRTGFGEVVFCSGKRDAHLKQIFQKLAEKEGLKSIAFCCISTGEFHFPNKLAAEIAVKTVDKYLSSSKLERVIFNVFKEEDYNIYKKIFA